MLGCSRYGASSILQYTSSPEYRPMQEIDYMFSHSGCFLRGARFAQILTWFYAFDVKVAPKPHELLKGHG